ALEQDFGSSEINIDVQVLGLSNGLCFPKAGRLTTSTSRGTHTLGISQPPNEDPAPSATLAVVAFPRWLPAHIVPSLGSTRHAAAHGQPAPAGRMAVGPHTSRGPADIELPLASCVADGRRARGVCSTGMR